MSGAEVPLRPPPLGHATADATYRLFRFLSRERRLRIFHPVGLAFDCEVSLRDTSPFGEPGTHRGLVRFSRALGVPRPIPDILGLALRVEDAHGQGAPQDVLLVSSAGSLLPVPAATFFGPRFSSLLPYRVGAALRVVVAQATAPAPAGGPEALAELARARDIGFRLWLEPYGHQLGELVVGKRLRAREAERLRFNPYNTGPDAVPAWLPNRLRDPAYRGSQDGRPIPGSA